MYIINVFRSSAAFFHTDSPVLEALDTTVRAQTNSSVTLSCEIYGYLPYGDQPQISWQKLPNMLITSNGPLYTISSTSGSKQIQNGSSTPGPSFISSLIINVVDETVAGTYICSSSDTPIQTIVLTVPLTTGRPNACTIPYKFMHVVATISIGCTS